MDESEVVTRTADYVRSQMEDDATGHDWWHVWRVWQTAKRLGEHENADLFVVELAALLHDVADWKLHNGDLSAGPKAAREWLQQLDVDKSIIAHVSEIVGGISFKGAGVATPMATIEGQCVQDADRLDAIGAVGIARCFAFGGAKDRLIFDPEHPPELHDSFEAYRKKSGPSINHFYEKLLLLKDRMHTDSGRELAEQRHQFLQTYLDQFFAEWGVPAPSEHNQMTSQ